MIVLHVDLQNNALPNQYTWVTSSTTLPEGSKLLGFDSKEDAMAVDPNPIRCLIIRIDGSTAFVRPDPEP